MRNVILTGMPGSGKSTVGVLLAKTLGMEFLDCDLVIQSRENALLQDIINSRGIEAFLEAEQKALLSIRPENTVISTGGSAVCREKSMLHMGALGVVVYLRLSPRALAERVNNITSRGIAMEKGQTLEDIYRLRAPLYERYADLTVDAEGQTLEETVAAVAEAVRNA